MEGNHSAERYEGGRYIDAAGNELTDFAGPGLTVSAGALTAPGGGASVESNLLAGRIVGVTGRNTYVEAPSDYATDDAAMQAVVDAMQAAGDAGYLRFSPYDDLGNELLLEDTVTMTGGSAVSPLGYGFFGNDGGGFLRTAIGDGSPMFLMEDMQLQATVTGHFSASGDGQIQDAEAIRIRNCSGGHVDMIDARGLGGSAGSTAASGAIVFDSQAYNFDLTRCRYNGITDGGNQLDVSGSRFIAFENTLGTTDPGEMQISHLSTYAAPARPFDAVVYVSDGGNLKFSTCRFEGAGGVGMVNIQSGNAAFSNCRFDRTENDCIGLNADGTYVLIDGSCNGDTLGGGEALRVNCGYGGYIGSTHWQGGSTAPSGINVTLDPPNDALSLPNRNTVSGTVSYPSGTANVYERDATRL